MTLPAAAPRPRLLRRELLALLLATLLFGFLAAKAVRSEPGEEEEAGAHAPPFGRTLLAESGRFAARRMGIYRKDERVGWAQTLLEPQPDGGAVLRTTAEAKLQLLRRRPVLLRCESSLYLDAKGEPLHLLATLTAENRPDLGVSIEGMRQGSRMRLLLRLAGSTLLEYEIPAAGGSVDTGLLPVGDLPGLSEGLEWPIRYVNPLTRQPERGRARVTGRETLEWEGEPLSAWRVEIDFPANTYLRPVALVAPDGRLLTLAGIGDYLFRREEPAEEETAQPPEENLP